MSGSWNWFSSWRFLTKTKRQPIKQHETKGIQELLNTLNDLRMYLTNLVKDLNEMERKLLETISGISQPVVPKETKKYSPFKAPNKSPAEPKGLAVSYPNSNDSPVSRSDASINDVIAGFLTDQTSTEKSFMHHANEVFDTLYNQMRDFLKRKAPLSTYESNETNVKGILTDQQSTRRITNLEEGKRVDVQIYISKDANLPNYIIHSLYELLESGISKKCGDGVTLLLKTRNEPKYIDPTMPLIVLCPVVFRIGVSVNDALKGVQRNENVILLILHHAAKHAMNILSSTKMLTLPNLGCILDMFFHNEQGIHKCKQNDDTVARITEFLSQCNQMTEFLDGNTRWSPYESNEKKVKRTLTDQQSSRRITNLEEGIDLKQNTNGSRTMIPMLA